MSPLLVLLAFVARPLIPESNLMAVADRAEVPEVADELLAMGNDGTAIDVLGVKVDHLGPGARLRTSATLPAIFRGGPLFDARGDLAALALASGAARASSVRRLLGQK